MFDRRLIINFDFFLLFVVILVSFFGVVNLKSICTSSGGEVSPFFYKQIYWIIIGLCCLLIIININYLSIIKYAYYFHVVTIVVLLFVLFFGKTIYGSQRWISLGPISIQPSEITKITFILALAKFYTENISQKAYILKDLFMPALLLLATFLPIYFQPDLGTAGIILLIFIFMSFFVNINKKTLFFIFSTVLVLMPFFWFFLKDYQKNRVLVFLNPERDPLNAGYQVIQSKIAVGSGGFLGKGFMLGTQSQLRFLPEQHTDFVFSVWAEEWGFVACFFLLLLFFSIVYRGLAIASESKNVYGSFLAIGISALFFWQISINIFMTLGLFPVVGVPLPFFTYGGSSMLCSMFGIAFLLNISMRKFT
jgi:rod shape determining protein RodA